MRYAEIFSDETENFRIPAEPAAGEPVRVRLRLPRDREASVFLHVSAEGTEALIPAEKAGEHGCYADYEAVFTAAGDRSDYYFVIGEEQYYGRNGLKEQVEDIVPFSVLPGFHVPAWARGAVWYQIFVDRFANGDPGNDPADGEFSDDPEYTAEKASWNEPVRPRDVHRFCGGDLQGILDKLDYLKTLGAEVLYLSPVFVSPSSHKYNTQDYDHVDPHFGCILKDGEGPERYAIRTTEPENLESSDALFAKLIAEAHRRGMRVVADGVFNHCGAFHKWMDRRGIYWKNKDEVGAWWDKSSRFRPYFTFWGNDSYECWWNNETLPKLNVDGCPDLREELLGIAEKWLKPPYSLDGWRLDVAADLGHSPEANHAFWQDFRKRVRYVQPEAMILAEHYGDPSPWLGGAEWDSVMNYDAFMEPVSWFLTGMEKHSDRYDETAEGDGELFFRSMEESMSRMPAPAAFSALNELDNHDHSRFLTRTGKKTGRLRELGSEAAEEDTDKSLLRAAVLLQMSWPGAPGIYYGDEAGLCGFTDPDSRRPYPWGEEDLELQDFYVNAVHLHRASAALRCGSLVPLKAEQGLIAYGRFTAKECALTVIRQADEEGTLELDLGLLTGTKPKTVTRVLQSTAEGYHAGRKTLALENGILQLELGPHEASLWLWDRTDEESKK